MMLGALLLAALAGRGAVDAGMTGLDQELIRREIRANHARTWACYERNLSAESVTDFRVVLTFVVAPSGQVEAVQAKSSIASADVEACLIAEAKTWRFPKFIGSAVSVRYPFIFKADED